MKKSILAYLLVFIAFGFSMFYIIQKGGELNPVNTSNTGIAANTLHPAAHSPTNTNTSIWDRIAENIHHPIALLLLQILVILAISRVFGVLIRRMGQTSVIGEIIAGIVLGPSVMGLLFPDFSAFLFPADSLKQLQFLSQIGLAFFMFTVGMELNLASLKHKASNAIVISNAGILVPFLLGTITAYFIYEEFALPHVNFLAFALFMGIAMSITAFPVLARIIREKGLLHTPMGSLVITCAATDDISAWCILAVVIAVAKAGSMAAAFLTIALTIAFILLMVYAVRPLLKKLGERPILNDNLDKSVVAIAFFVLMVSAWITELIGIHALFGAFMAGIIMPSNKKFKDILTFKLEDVSTLLLLPIFFAITGLRTHIGLLNESYLWAICIVIIFVAVLGKFGGSTLASRLVGQSWKDSLSIGVLMNTRGLVELVVLNIGYEMGILSTELFAIMVLMALATTFMTSPLLDLIEYAYRKRLQTNVNSGL